MLQKEDKEEPEIIKIVDLKIELDNIFSLDSDSILADTQMKLSQTFIRKNPKKCSIIYCSTS